ncbi:hypothetical protein AB0A63_19415 [Lentzea sp. NPDC042327]|uniref:hypothetical protein n=1 Tax=Lentzea sp. NPDC042327 TaxID=3154801 RepID=UPI0033EC73AE
MDALGSILGGTFSGCAFLATLFLLTRETRLRRAEQHAAMVRQEDENARQARLIVSAIAKESYPLKDGFKVLEMDGVVTNYSDMPIFNLVVQMEDIGGGQEGFRMVKPGESVRTQLHVHRPADSGSMDMSLPRKVGLSLHFLDANGRHWRRKGSGQPEHVLSDALSEAVPMERYRPDAAR